MNLPQDLVMLVLTNVPDEACAERITRALLDERLVACVNRMADVHSSYLWKGRLEEAREIPLLMKTVAGRVDALERRLCELHPYEVPEFVAWPAARVYGPYAQWVRDCCPPPPLQV